MSDNLGDFGRLINSICKVTKGTGDKGQAFPESDSIDLQDGADYIPPQVTVQRRKGEKIIFVKEGSLADWYWLMPDGTKIFHG